MATPEPLVRFQRLPVDGPVTGRFGDEYVAKERRWLHRGVDFGVPTGTPVYAPAPGRVVEPVNDGSFGVAVALAHADGWVTLYAHLSRAAVAPGQVVREGDLLGWSGATGMVTGPHVHWQLCRDRTFPLDISWSRDPMRYLAEEATEGDEMTPEERELLLRVATILFGDRSGLDFADINQALAVARRLTANDTVVLLGLAETQAALARHTHDASGRPTWPGKVG